MIDAVAFFRNFFGTQTMMQITRAGLRKLKLALYLFTVVAAVGYSSAAFAQAPAITTSPTSQTVGTGTTASFTAAATGTPTPTVQWRLSTDGGATFNDIAGATATTLSFTAQLSDSGRKYQAIFTNGFGTATTFLATLTVNNIAPAITANPANLTVGTGTTASFTASSTGAPTPTVQWQRSTDGGVTFGNIVGATATALSFTAQLSDNGNRYRAVFANSQGVATTTSATLTVNLISPAITANPSNLTVGTGTTASFTASSTGAPTPTVQWQRSTDGGATFGNIVGATATTLSFTAQLSDNGNRYRAVFANSQGVATTTSATLTVNSIAPAITANPANQTVNAGTTASFTAAANGAPTPTVQWQLSTDGGVTFGNIAGATATTLSFAAQLSDNGNRYRAVFTNSQGSATTTNATLTANVGAASSMTANAGTTPQSVVVTTALANAPAVTVTDAGNNPVPGVNVTFTAPGAGASGAFANATATIAVATNASGVAAAPFTANATTGGPYTVTAAAAGLTTVNFALTNVAAKAAVTVTLVSSLNPATTSQTVTFTAAVSGAAPTGSVTFKDGATTLGTATLGGSGQAALATSSLSAGSHPITAVYGGDAGNNGGTSAVLTQTVNTSADSLKLRALQALVTPMVAQASGQAISSAVDNAINEGFSEDGAFIAPSGSGIRFNFAADPGASVTDAAPRAGAPVGPRSPSSRIGDTFSALALAEPDKAPPRRVSEPREWLGWAEVHGTTLDRWGSSTAAPTASLLYGNQINLLAGLTRKFTPNFLIGVLGGYETFDYRSDTLQGRLKGDGWTVGSYLGWKITQNIRFDTAIAYSGIGYNGTAGIAAGAFGGTRWMLTSGLTGTYTSYGIQIEPSARVYALRERENAYTDTLGTLQGARDFSAGRASGGVKLSYPILWSATTVLAPYAGLYGDYYFNSDSAGAAAAAAAAIPSILILDGWSARATAGLMAKFSNGAQIAVSGERGGIGGNFGLWTYRARASVPFGAQ